MVVGRFMVFFMDVHKGLESRKVDVGGVGSHCIHGLWLQLEN